MPRSLFLAAALAALPLLAAPAAHAAPTQVHLFQATHDVVVEQPELGSPQVADPLGPDELSSFATQSAVAQCIGQSGAGLPDDGRFPATGSHPPVALDFDAFAGNNAFQFGPADGNRLLQFSETDPANPNRPDAFLELHVIAASAGGPTRLLLDGDYAGGGEFHHQPVVGDWKGAGTGDGYVLASGLRGRHAAVDSDCDPVDGPRARLYGVALPMDPRRTVQQLTLARADAGDPDARLNVLGIVGVHGFRLTTATAGGGVGTVTSAQPEVDCATTCTTAPIAEYRTVALKANPAPGSVFAGWSGACSGTAECRVPMTAAKSVTATFQPAPPKPQPQRPADPKPIGDGFSRPIKVPFANIAKAPRGKRCVTPRSFKLRLRRPAGQAVSHVRVTVGKKRKTLRGKALRRAIRKAQRRKALPKGRWTLRIRMTLSDGRVLVATRRYRTCAPKKR